MRLSNNRNSKARTKRFYRPDGDNVKLPHELWRAPLWTTANQHTLARAEERECPRHVKNSYGDTYHIYSDGLLRPSPDMSVLLSVIALCQRKYVEAREEDNTENCTRQAGQMEFMLPITELYEATGIPARHRGRLIASMKRLSSVHIEINRLKPINGKYDACMSYLFKYEVIKRKKGERCDTIRLELHRSLEPRDRYIFKSSRACSRLKNDTARLLFWLMASRQHISIGRTELYRALIPTEIGVEAEPTAKSVNEWAAKRLRPAIKELEALGWKIRYERGNYTIHTGVMSGRGCSAQLPEDAAALQDNVSITSCDTA